MARSSTHEFVDSIVMQAGTLAREAVDLQLGQNPEMAQRYGKAALEASRRDARDNLLILAETHRVGESEVLAQHTRWLTRLFLMRGLHLEDLRGHWRILADLVEESVDPAAAKPLRVTLGMIDEGVGVEPPFLSGDTEAGRLGLEYLQRLWQGSAKSARELLLERIRGGMDLEALLVDVLQPAMYEVGRLWMAGEIDVAKEHYASQVSQTLLMQLRVEHESSTQRPLVLAAGVGQELHQMGLQMLVMVLERHGWGSYFLGANTPLGSILLSARELRPDLVALTVSSGFYLSQAKVVVDSLRSSLPEGTPILVGGYYFNRVPGLHESVGADGTAPDARDALTLVETLRKES